MLYYIAVAATAANRYPFEVAIDPVKDYPGYLLRQASAANMEKLARSLAGLGLRPSEWTVLSVVDANADITQSAIGRMLNIARANMAPLIARLTRRKLLERRQVDGRSQGLRLTGTGRALAQKARAVVEAHEAELLSKIPATQRKAFLAGLRALWSPD